uniref:Ppx/GppA phosphatase family protein n=1 Tax=Armatimonas sp. TaxID=1872638 RepID=UPI00286A4AC9
VGAIQPLVAACLAYRLLGERITASIAGAGAVGAVGVALLVLRAGAHLDGVGLSVRDERAGSTVRAGEATGVDHFDSFRADAEGASRAWRGHLREPRTACRMVARTLRTDGDRSASVEGDGVRVAVFVLSGEQEAELGFLAVAEDPLFADDDCLSIIDPGGQSTELVTAVKLEGKWEVRFRKSFPIGTLGLRGTVLSSESPSPPEILNAVIVLDDLIGMEFRPGAAGRAVVLGASGTNLVTIRDRMTEWDAAKVHGAWLDFEEVSKAVGWMMPMTDLQRSLIIGIEPGREKTIHLGSLILERFLWSLHVLGVTVSVRGWRHALLAHGLRPS